MKSVADFSCRSDEVELMDQGGIPFAEFHHCLQDLETINQLTLAYRPTLRWLSQWMTSEESLCVLDVGSGGGDMLRRMEGQAKRKRAGSGKQPVNLIGVDLHPWARQSAELCSPNSSVRFVTADVFRFEADQPIDLVVCSLFTHHLTESQLVHFLRWIDSRSRKGWFINDLHRHALPYYFIKIATRLFSRNRLIRNDAAVSVARSFTVADWRRLLDKAGLSEEVRIQWFFPFRLCVSREKSHAQQNL